MRDLIGRTLGHYRVVDKIGEGGMGEVYRAHDERLDRDVAIKVLPVEVAGDAGRLERFEREARAVAALSHPNILAIHDFGLEGGITFAVTELLEGSSLRERIPPKGMDWQRVTEIGAAVASGLAAAHGKGIIHRDLKPENIFLTADGQVKILDFGLAQVREEVDEDAETATLTPAGTVPGTVMGTVGYMSPEQVRGEPTTTRSDIFALGCVLYEMLSGQKAFRRRSTAETYAAILKEEPPSLSTSCIALPGELERTIRRCLEKTADARFQSASDLAYDLKSISTDQAIRLPPAERRNRMPLLVAAAVVVGLVVLAFLLGPGLLDRAGSVMGEGDASSIAILPLQNLTGDPEQAYFVDGLHEEMISTFARISAFDKVIARTSVLGFKDSATSIREIGEQLGVDLVLEGSVRRGDDTVRTTLQLIDANTEDHLWANSFESDLTDILALQSDVARAVAKEIELALTPQEETLLTHTRTVNPEAYDAYLKGLSYWDRLTQPGLDTALQYFELSHEKDPDNALAHVGVALVWIGRRQMRYTSPHEAGPKVKAAVSRALELDDTLAETHHALAIEKVWGEWDWEAAETAFRRAIELNPNYANVRRSYAHFLMIMKRPDEAMTEMERALSLDPFNPMTQIFYAGLLLYSARRPDDAIAVWQKSLQLVPDHPAAGNSWRAYAAKGLYDEAFEALKEVNLLRGNSETVETLERGYAEGGFQGAMRLLADKEAARSHPFSGRCENVAKLYAFAGEDEKALEWLERGFEERDSHMPYFGVFPAYDGLRDEPRFQALLRRMNFPEDVLARYLNETP